MQFSKLKIFTFGLALIGLFLGGFLGFCSALSKDVYASAFEKEHSAMTVIGKSASGCCEIHTAKNNYFKLFALSTTENKNFGLGTALFAALMLGVLVSLFAFTKKYIAAKIYYLRQIISIFYNHLLWAFSQGLLNPKIYNV